MNGTNPNNGQSWQGSQPGQDIRIPMDELSFIKREKLEYPMCACGRDWLPLYIPAMKGYVRQCPTCPLTASYCQCDFDELPSFGQQGAAF